MNSKKYIDFFTDSYYYNDNIYHALIHNYSLLHLITMHIDYYDIVVISSTKINN